MNRFQLVSVAMATAALTSVSAHAQTTTPPAGEKPLPADAAVRPGANQEKPTPSTKSRAAVKDETKDARRAGTLVPAGQQPLPAAMTPKPGTNKEAPVGSNESRSDVKADTKAARRAGELTPAGEATAPIKASQPK